MKNTVNDPYRAIGFLIDDQEKLLQLREEINPRTAEIPQPDGGTSHIWKDVSGAGWTFFQKGPLLCESPTFEGRSRLPVITRGFTGNLVKSCPYCRNLVLDVVDEDGHPFYQFAMYLQDMGTALGRLKMNVPSTAMILALGYDYRVYPSVRAYRDQRDVHPKDRYFAAGCVSEKSFFPLWLLQEDPGAIEWPPAASSRESSTEPNGASIR